MMRRRDTTLSTTRLCHFFYHYFWWIGFGVTLIGNAVLLSKNVQIVSDPQLLGIANSKNTDIHINNNYNINNNILRVDIHANTLIQDDVEPEPEQKKKRKEEEKQSSLTSASANSIPRNPQPSTQLKQSKVVALSSSTQERRRPEDLQHVFFYHSFSFCLLIKDDNDLLDEWLAYHYHTLNLRHVIVAVDPSSQTSPKEIFERWRSHFGLTFQLWHDEDYMPPFFLKGLYDNVPRMIKMQDKNATKWQEEGTSVSEEHLKEDYQRINNHRYRQAKFLQHCSKQLQTANKTWMTHIDTDEYIVLNPTIRHSATLETKNFMERPLPPSLTKNALWGLLEDLYERDPATINWPCLSMPRVLYGSVVDDDDNDETTTTTSTNTNHPPLETLTWKYHADYENATLNKQPKVIMDVSGFPPFNVSKKAFSIHRPSLRLCRGRGDIHLRDGANYPLTVNHYVGSLARYQARDDPRRTQKVRE
jgi:hypothetical protein